MFGPKKREGKRREERRERERERKAERERERLHARFHAKGLKTSPSPQTGTPCLPPGSHSSLEGWPFSPKENSSPRTVASACLSCLFLFFSLPSPVVKACGKPIQHLSCFPRLVVRISRPTPRRLMLQQPGAIRRNPRRLEQMTFTTVLQSPPKGEGTCTLFASKHSMAGSP